MATITELEWQSLSRVLEEIRTPYNFVERLLYGNTNTNGTEKIAVDSVIGGRRMAPFVRRGASAQLIPGMTHQFTTVEAPSIRAKRAFDCDRLFFERTPGSPIFIDGSTAATEVQRRIARDLQYAREQIDQTLEWMCCQTLTGTLTYNISTTDGQLGDAFTIDYGRPAAHTVVLTGTDLWSDAASDPHKDFNDAKDLASDAGHQLTDVIMGGDAADAFVRNDQLASDLDNRRFVTGNLELINRFEQSGAQFMGQIYGIRCWRYNRSVTDPFGNSVALIEADKAHFVSANPGADNIIEYGAIADFDASPSGLIQTRFFSKSWRTQDPSAQMYLWHSRPLPIPRRPESMVTYTVV